jgi:hypothetical protein
VTTLSKQKDSAEQDAGNLDRFITVQRLRGIVRSDPPPRALGLLVGHLAAPALRGASWIGRQQPRQSSTHG